MLENPCFLRAGGLTLRRSRGKRSISPFSLLSSPSLRPGELEDSRQMGRGHWEPDPEDMLPPPPQELDPEDKALAQKGPAWLGRALKTGTRGPDRVRSPTSLQGKGSFSGRVAGGRKSCYTSFLSPGRLWLWRSCKWLPLALEDPGSPGQVGGPICPGGCLEGHLFFVLGPASCGKHCWVL